MLFNRVKYKVLAAIGLSVGVVIVGLGLLFVERQEHAILEQNADTVHKLTNSVAQGLQSVMLAGYAHIAQGYADRLRQVPDVVDFRILRTDGTEAFRDNRTIEAVNRRRGDDQFVPRASESSVRVLPADSASLRAVLGQTADTDKIVSYPDVDARNRRALTFLDAIPNTAPCFRCHGSDHAVRGIVKITVSLLPVEIEILQTQRTTAVVAAITITAILLLTGYMISRSVLKPINEVTSAMHRAAGGDLAHQVPILANDELGQMARSFNSMAQQLRRTYRGLEAEQDKLTTIIHSTAEGIVVADGSGRVVLVNSAAELLLDKPADVIREGGLEALLDDPPLMQECLTRGVVATPPALAYKQRLLAVCASTIYDTDGSLVGSAAFLRDVTEQNRLERELKRQSITDGLTGLFNRRHFDHSLVQEFARARRYGAPLAVAMFDVDHFKRFNDEHGHDMGDRVLREVARALQAAVRGHDVACRYGGEEFVAILPGTDAPGAVALAERLRSDVAGIAVDGLRITVSIGVASCPEVGVQDAESLVKAADAALYEAKRAGRNRVVSAPGQFRAA